ncbi:NACHT domain-containing protein [Microseira sp. BLCC-F43]|uniref:NACHT domain-containing protein n=1 Tax=Microseira sp. BLCC-F43 TaxID=3153602 RepID=UPI0035B884AB
MDSRQQRKSQLENLLIQTYEQLNNCEQELLLEDNPQRKGKLEHQINDFRKHIDAWQKELATLAAELKSLDESDSNLDIDALVQRTLSLQVSPDKLQQLNQALETIPSVIQKKEELKQKEIEKLITEQAEKEFQEAEQAFKEVFNQVQQTFEQVFNQVEQMSEKEKFALENTEQMFNQAKQSFENALLNLNQAKQRFQNAGRVLQEVQKSKKEEWRIKKEEQHFKEQEWHLKNAQLLYNEAQPTFQAEKQRFAPEINLLERAFKEARERGFKQIYNNSNKIVILIFKWLMILHLKVSNTFWQYLDFISLVLFINKSQAMIANFPNFKQIDLNKNAKEEIKKFLINEAIIKIMSRLPINDSEREAFEKKLENQSMGIEKKAKLLANEDFVRNFYKNKVPPPLSMELKVKLLAGDMNLPSELIQKIFDVEAVAPDVFINICSHLNLEWRKILDVDFLRVVVEFVPQVRSQRHKKIKDQCATMRMLDISQPISISNIYTDVYILEEIACQQWRDISDLAQDFNPDSDDFDRLGLSKRHQRIPGPEAVSQHKKLMVLGKPGSGKTTFLQWIAVQCNDDECEFLSNLVPIFIRLRNFAEDTSRDNSESKLWNYIHQEFVSCGISEQSITEKILDYGKALILLDGLDEVPEKDGDEVITQIRRFAEKYFKNQFIITCRIAAQKYKFQEFTDVEVADFNQEQVEPFAKKWFVAVSRNNRQAGEAIAQQFLEKLRLPENQQIRELAVTPILLNLTCLVFQAKREFPSKRFKLYQQGLDILLVRWDESRGIKRDEVYRDLHLDRKKALLCHVAAITFENSRYFFDQSEVERYIADYLRTLHSDQTDPTILRRDSEVVLKSIEAQHGLLIERAREVYSFSHLTFQEYLTAQAFINSFTSQPLEKSVRNLTQKTWREVFLLAASQIEDAHLLLMKQKIDALAASEQKLQHFMNWVIVQQKSFAFEFTYNLAALAAIRKFYFDVYFTSKTVLANNRDSNLLAKEIYLALNPHLHKLISQQKRLLDAEDKKAFYQWRESKGKTWYRDLVSTIAVRRDMGDNFQVSKLYYDANNLLLDFLDRSQVSPGVRQEIEETLLLPLSEIEQGKSNMMSGGIGSVWMANC